MKEITREEYRNDFDYWIKESDKEWINVVDENGETVFGFGVVHTEKSTIYKVYDQWTSREYFFMDEYDSMLFIKRVGKKISEFDEDFDPFDRFSIEECEFSKVSDADEVD